MKIFQALSHAILIGLLAFGAVLLALSYLLSLEARQIHQEAMEDHFFMGFLNTVLEVRRYEKAYLVFHKKHEWERAVSYLDLVDRQLRDDRAAFLACPDGQEVLDKLSALATEYRERLLQAPSWIEQDAQTMQPLELALHRVGGKLIRQAEHLAADTKDDITTALQHTQRAIMIADGICVLMLFAYGTFCLRRIFMPIHRIKDGLTNILAGRQEQIELFGRDQEFRSLTNLINLTIQAVLHKREERALMAQQAFADTVLLRLVKTLGQPMANISTTCQILMEENPHAAGAFQQDMLLQIQQQAEQGRRLLLTIQDYVSVPTELAEPLLLAPLIERVMANLAAEQAGHVAWEQHMPTDLAVTGNPYTLERAFTDLIGHALQSVAAYPGTIEGCRRNRESMRVVLASSSLRPLVWLHPDCGEVVEIALPMANELPTGSEHSTHDVSSLCVPQEDGNPGICLLPGIVRQHGGAMLAERLDDAILLFRLWLPAAHPTQEDGMEHAAGNS